LKLNYYKKITNAEISRYMKPVCDFVEYALSFKRG